MFFKIKSSDYGAIFDKIFSVSFLSRIFSKSSPSSNSKPAFEFLFPYAVVLLIGFIVADLGTLYLRPFMLPNEAPPKKPTKRKIIRPESKSVYTPIVSRNIFNSDGKIPPSLSDLQKSENGEEETTTNDSGPATLSRLPLKLLGTIVHANPKKSIATVNLSSQNKTGSWQVDEDMNGIAKIIEVQRRKVIIRNLNNNKKEYIEIPVDNKVSFNNKKKVPQKSSASNDMVKMVGDTRVIKKSDFLAQTKNMGQLLRQASMAPNKGPDGSIQGFKFLSIKPGSVYEKLGFQNGDVLKGVNNEPVNSAAKAMELYNALKGDASKLDINMSRGGKDTTFNYKLE